MREWIAVSFFTVGTGYETEIKRFIESAIANKIRWMVYPKPNTGSWRGNLDFKSAVILEAMADHAGRDIVWVDADGVFRSYPTLFDELSNCGATDIAFHRFKQSRLEPHRELLSGTLWIANTEIGRRIVTTWHDYARRHHEIRHQKCLDIVINQSAEPVRVHTLPLEYCAIYDHPAVRGRITPVIEHFQASRRFRRSVAGGPIRPDRSPWGGR